MADEELQAWYAEVNKRGLFKKDAELQAWGHELRKRGIIKDATQGGLVTPRVANATPPAAAQPTTPLYVEETKTVYDAQGRPMPTTVRRRAKPGEEATARAQAKRQVQASTLALANDPQVNRPDLNYAQGGSQSVTGKSRLKSGASLTPQKPLTVAQAIEQWIAKAGEVVAAPAKKAEEMAARAILEGGAGDVLARQGLVEYDALTRYNQAKAKDRTEEYLKNNSFWQAMRPNRQEELARDPSVVGGVTRFGANLLTPGNLIPLGAIGKGVPGIGRVLGGAFGIPAVAQGGQQIQQAQDVGQMVEGLLNTLVGAAGVKHAITPTPQAKPPVRGSQKKTQIPLPPQMQATPRGTGATVFAVRNAPPLMENAPLRPRGAEPAPFSRVPEAENPLLAELQRRNAMRDAQAQQAQQAQQVQPPATMPAPAPVEAAQTPKPAEVPAEPPVTPPVSDAQARMQAKPTLEKYYRNDYDENSGGRAFSEVQGKPVTIPGFESHDMFITRNRSGDMWQVLDGRTGSGFGSDTLAKTQKEAIQLATAKLQSRGEEAFASARQKIEDTYGVSPRYKPSAEPTVKERLAAEANAARARLSRPNSLQTGIRPEHIRDYAIIAADNIVKGVEWTGELVRQAGEAIRPHLAEIERQAQEYINRLQTTTKAGVPQLTRNIPEMVESAQNMSSWKDWYNRYQGTLREVFGEDSELFQKLLSATSQGASVPSNVGLAIKAYRQMKGGEPFQGYLPAVAMNLERIRNEQALAGRKISEYGRANDGEEGGIAVDRHVAELLFGDGTKRPTPAQITHAQAAIRVVAQRLGWEAREVQAALWAANIERKGGVPQSYDTHIEKPANLEKIRAIRAEDTGGTTGSRAPLGTDESGTPTGAQANVGTERAGIAAKLNAAEQSVTSRLQKKLKDKGLQAGVDPEDFALLAELGAIKIAKGAVSFADFSRDLLTEAEKVGRDYAESLAPHLKQLYQDATSIHAAKYIAPPQDTQNRTEATENAQTPQGRVNRPAEATPAPENLLTMSTKPAEPQKPLTGAKNATTEAERADRGQSPIERQAYTLVGEAYAQGKSAVTEGRTDPRALAASVAQKPRPLTAAEVGALAYDRAQIIKEHDATTAELARAVDSGDTAKIAELQAKQERLLSDLDANDNALVKGGREQSAAFNARKMMVGQDFSFAGVQQRAKAAKGAPLTPMEKQQIETLTARLKDAETRLSAAESALKDAQAKTPTPRQKAAGGSLKERLIAQMSESDRARLDAAVARAKSKLTQVGAAPDVSILGDVIEIGTIYTKAGLKELKAWRAQMQADIPGIDDETLNQAWRHISVNAGREKRLGAQLSTLGGKIIQGDFTLPKRSTPPPPTVEVKRLQAQRDMLKATIQARIDRMRPKTLGQKVAEVASVPRSLMTSFDLSAPLRQGSVLTLANPRLGVKNIAPMLRAFAKEETAQIVENEIKARANYPDYEASKLYLAPLNEISHLSKREEAFMSTLAERIPGVRASERAYVTYLNKLRADTFDMFKSQLPNATGEELAAVADFINTATGRGKLGATGERAATLLNNIFFSPRYLTSRVQMLAGEPLYRGNARTRRLIARTYLQYAGAVSGVVLLAKASGATVETDPNHTDFLKIKYGNKVFDVLAGLQQAGTFLSRMITGKKTSATGNTSDLSAPKFGGGTRLDLGVDFLRGKAAPVPGSAMNLLSGKDLGGKPVTPQGEAMKLLIPMSWPDVYQAAKEEGIPPASAIFLLSLFGVGANYRSPADKTPKGGAKAFSLPGTALPKIAFPKVP